MPLKDSATPALQNVVSLEAKKFLRLLSLTRDNSTIPSFEDLPRIQDLPYTTQALIPYYAILAFIAFLSLIIITSTLALVSRRSLTTCQILLTLALLYYVSHTDLCQAFWKYITTQPTCVNMVTACYAKTGTTLKDNFGQERRFWLNTCNGAGVVCHDTAMGFLHLRIESWLAYFK